MKLLNITPSYYPATKYGGPIFSMHLLNKELVKKGIEVYVLTTNTGLKKNKNIKLNTWIDIEGVKVKYLPYYFYENFTFSPRFLIELIKELQKFDLIHITGIWNFTFLIGSFISILMKKPYIISPHGVLYKETIKIKSSLNKKIYLQLFGKFFLKKANAIHYTSMDEKVNVENYLELRTKSFIVSNGLDLSDFKELPNKGSFAEKYINLKNQKYILFLSRLDKKKGLDLLLPAFKELSLKYPDIYLVIVGPDNTGYKKDLDKLVKYYSLNDKILFTGELKKKEKISAYTDAELLVLPSYSENFGMVVIEAMACGTPVVISNKVGISKEVLDYNAGVITNLDPDNIKNAMILLLDNKLLKDTMVSNGYKLVEKMYDIKTVADEIIREFKGILSSK